MRTFLFQVRVYIEDTDYAGVVYHANYLNYFARARCEWADQLGFGTEWQQGNQIFFPVRQIQIDFKKPARLRDKLEVVTEIKTVKPASLLYYQYLRHADAKATILCEAETKIACVNADLKPCLLPNLVKDSLTGDPTCDV